MEQPSRLVTILHSIPHLNYTFRRVNDTFNPDSDVYLEVSTNHIRPQPQPKPLEVDWGRGSYMFLMPFVVLQQQWRHRQLLKCALTSWETLKCPLSAPPPHPLAYSSLLLLHFSADCILICLVFRLLLTSLCVPYIRSRSLSLFTLILPVRGSLSQLSLCLSVCCSLGLVYSCNCNKFRTFSISSPPPPFVRILFTPFVVCVCRALFLCVFHFHNVPHIFRLAALSLSLTPTAFVCHVRCMCPGRFFLA